MLDNAFRRHDNPDTGGHWNEAHLSYSLRREPAGYRLRWDHSDRCGELFESRLFESSRDMAWTVQRRFLGHVHTSLDAVGVETARIDHALEPEREVRNQRQRPTQRDQIRRRWCGRHLYGHLVRHFDVRELQVPARRGQVERSQETLEVSCSATPTIDRRAGSSRCLTPSRRSACGLRFAGVRHQGAHIGERSRRTPSGTIIADSPVAC
jgi:hypothetical protein